MIRERGRGLFTTLLTFFGRCFLGRSLGSRYTIVAIHHCLYFLLIRQMLRSYLIIFIN